MSAFVISLVVVCAAVVITLGVALKHETEPDKPATPPDERHRASTPAVQPAPAVPPEWGERAVAPSPLRRVRSALLLVIIVSALGALTALLMVIGGAILLSGVRNAVQ